MTIPANGPLPPLGSWRCCAGFVLLAGCAVPDPAVFDERLRAATFDQHARAIALQLEASRADCSEARLRAAFRARALAATTPAEFRAVLVDLLLSLQDPHADFEPADQPWQQVRLGSRTVLDDAQPEFADVVRSDGSWWIASRPPLATASTELGPRLLASSGDAAVAPLWQRLEAIDGRAIRSRNDAQLLLRGPLLRPVQATVIGTQGERTTLELPRNALRTRGGPSLALIVPPRQLAVWCDPELAAEPAPRITVGGPDLRDTFARSRAASFRGGTVVQACSGFGAGRDLQVWRDGAVGFLRLGSLALAGDLKVASRAIEDAIAGLAGCDTVILDLLDNHGGSWDLMGYTVSHFLPAGMQLVPHRGEQRTRHDGWLVSTIEVLDARLVRAAVPELRPRQLFVLVDQWTVSAAEILAAVLRCKVGATLIGEPTAGAETWIHEVPGPDGSLLTFGLPGGMCDGCEGFQGRGLRPDREVALASERLHAVGLENARREHRRAVRAAAFAAAGLDPGLVLEPE